MPIARFVPVKGVIRAISAALDSAPIGCLPSLRTRSPRPLARQHPQAGRPFHPGIFTRFSG